MAKIHEPNHNACLWFGTFGSALEAARTYNNVARHLYGDCACLNLQLPPPWAVAIGGGGGGLAVVVSSPSPDTMVACPIGGGGGHNRHHQYLQQQHQ